jgi:ankyrin repeat protein
LRLAAELEENKGLEIARFLLDHGADANMSDDIEQPLYTAVLYKNIEIARLLIEHGANVNPKTLCKEDNGWTPLHSAVYFEEFDIAELLLDHGADPSIQDDEGKTPLDIAMEEREKTDDETTQRQYDEILDKLRTQDA